MASETLLLDLFYGALGLTAALFLVGCGYRLYRQWRLTGECGVESACCENYRGDGKPLGSCCQAAFFCKREQNQTVELRRSKRKKLVDEESEKAEEDEK